MSKPATSATGARIESLNPATGARLGSVAVAAAEEVAATVAATAAVQPLWAQLRLADRARYLRRTAQAVIDEFDELAQLIAREQGRPLVEAQTLELLPAIDALRWLASAGLHVLGEQRIPVPQALFPFKRGRVVHEPVGVVAVIGAGSAPLALPLCQIASALMGGNGVVFKPSPRASLVGERVVALLSRAGLPEGLVRIVHGGAEAGSALVGGDVARVLFVGRRAAGREVRKACAASGTPCVLELGGADAMIVLEDANVPRAVAAGVWAACSAAGQSHGALKRVFVARERHDHFVAQLVAGAAALTAGDPVAPATQLGPLASPQRRDRFAQAVAEAVAAGAELHCGEPIEPPGLSGAFHSPVVLTGVTPAMRVMRESLCGPLLAVAAIDDSVQAVALANADQHGLGASVWTADRYRAARIAHELEAGMVWINDHLPAAVLGSGPWGAVKGGSIGRSLGADGLRTCVEPKLVTSDSLGGRSPWWHPYDATAALAAQTLAELRSARDPDREHALRHGSVAIARVLARAARGARSRH